MVESVSEAEEWLANEDRLEFDARRSRLDWLIDAAPEAEFWMFPGGFLARASFEEARYCFVYGQFTATVLVGLSYTERTLAALFYASGRDDLERANLSRLLKEARNSSLLTDQEFNDLERARGVRNDYAHFRRPGHETNIERRALAVDQNPYVVIERDAMAVLSAALRMVAKNAV